MSDAAAPDVPALVAIDAISSHTPWSHRLFADEIASPVSHVLVARRDRGDRAVVGFVCWSVVAGELEIRNVAVHPDERRRGVGRELVRAVLENARGLGAVTAHLEVREANHAARALYASLGFETAGTRPAYYGQGEDAVRMRLRLT